MFRAESRLGGAESDEGIRFSDAQKAFVLKQGSDGMPVADVCRKAGISQATLLQLEEEIRRPAAERDAAAEAARRREREMKRIVAELSLDKEMLQNAIRRKL